VAAPQLLRGGHLKAYFKNSRQIAKIPKNSGHLGGHYDIKNLSIINFACPPKFLASRPKIWAA